MKKIISKVLLLLSGMIIGAVSMGNLMNGKLIEKYILSEKHRILFQLMSIWVKVKQERASLPEYFHHNGMRNIAIYGFGAVGQLLKNELKGSDISATYIIDRNTNSWSAEDKIYTPDDELPDVDAIVVTAVTYFDEIEKMLSPKMKCPIVSLEDILFDLV